MAEKSQKAKHSSQGPFVLWHGMNVGKALRLMSMRPCLHWTRALRVALLPPMAMYNSTMSAIENLAYGRAVRNTEIEHPPVFILGHWRSGTTLLHNLLTRDPQFTFPNTYQCLFPSHFLLTGTLAPKLTAFLLPKTRPMDNVPCSWDLPQEDEFALATLTLLSPYLMTTFSEDFKCYEGTFDFEGASEKAIAEWKDAFRMLIRKITYRTPKPIVFKNPAHTYRVPYLLDMFPDAKFLYIYRNPYDTFRSTVHLRKTVVRENELGRAPLVGHEEEVLFTYKLAFDCYERDRHLIPEGRLHEIRFEDLEVDPLGELEKTYEGLNLSGFEQLKAILEPEVPALRRYKKNRFNDDSEWIARVCEEFKDAYERFGYEPPSQDGQQPTTAPDEQTPVGS